MNARPAVFIDKDGTLVRDVPYNADPALIEWRPGVLEGLASLHAEGYALVVVSNQSGIAHGKFTEMQLAVYFDELASRMRAARAPLTAIEYCPHHPDGTRGRYRRFCACRKPNPGMLVRAAARHWLDLERSWMIGDILDDVEAGTRAGCSTILVEGTELNEAIPSGGLRSPDTIAPDMRSACDAVLAARREVAV